MTKPMLLTAAMQSKQNMLLTSRMLGFWKDNIKNPIHAFPISCPSDLGYMGTKSELHGHGVPKDQICCSTVIGSVSGLASCSNVVPKNNQIINRIIAIITPKISSTFVFYRFMSIFRY